MKRKDTAEDVLLRKEGEKNWPYKTQRDLLLAFIDRLGLVGEFRTYLVEHGDLPANPGHLSASAGKVARSLAKAKGDVKSILNLNHRK